MDPAGITLDPLDTLLAMHANRLERRDFTVRLALDSRLAELVTGAREPMLAQLKLAWWRDLIRDSDAMTSAGDPLIEALATRPVPGAAELVDAWEALLLHRDSPNGLRAAAVARGTSVHGVMADGEGGATALAWSLWSLWMRAGDHAIGASAGSLLRRMDAPGERLPRRLRPLAMLRWRIMRDRASRSNRPAAWSPRDWPRLAFAGLTGY